jgi:hypothetical protein
MEEDLGRGLADALPGSKDEGWRSGAVASGGEEEAR